jgi:hypothetical protein
MAEKILEELNRGIVPSVREPTPPAPETSRQALLFTPEDLILQEIAGCQPDRMTPLEALSSIARWNKDLKRKTGD